MKELLELLKFLLFPIISGENISKYERKKLLKYKSLIINLPISFSCLIPFHDRSFYPYSIQT